MSINKLIATGRLTADPALAQINGVDCASFTLACDTRIKDGNGAYLTNFYRCSAWRKMSEICMRYLHKGDKVSVVGDLSLRPYKDKNGNERLAVQLSITDLDLPAKAQNTAASESAAQIGNTAPANTNVESESDDEFPF